ncbi:DUF523 domain-containing protein [Erwiniaceae bacterium BAC15a-03b]|uniref:DUF523 domain-containing protein n=1 Tax=Winslowiella arboricola TaxID=2978220 RepID=A0A9J6PGJ1_9GAMM|nr:DUF523 domain-containing protein [Winslowiella arboricola]MCU5771180.1 DUF523 domain-containing protein [Winslowiella arboricola]MCU5776482.1 DUF523 domain-containing protein [Winslowiella arboricola]
MQKILLSACLAGFPVRYNGSAKTLVNHCIARWRQQNRFVVFCPELAAGFQTPRPAAEIQPAAAGYGVISHGATVREASGGDVTERYILAAWLTLEMAQQHNCQFAILTEGSPSCGSKMIYSGGFNGSKIAGQGVTAELLTRHGIEVFSESTLAALCQRLADEEPCDIPCLTR